MQRHCSPGGIFYDALTPKPSGAPSPAMVRGTPRQALRGEGSHGICTLLEAASQDENNHSAPTTPVQASRAIGRRMGGHHRNSQSMSALPTTPLRSRTSLLPSANVVPQTEPHRRFAEPATPTPRGKGRKSRESTISVEGEDNDMELARQALQSVQDAARRSMASSNSQGNSYAEESDVFGSQASQAATELLRRDARQSFELRRPAERREEQAARDGSAAATQARLLTSLRSGTDKRKFSGQHGSMDGLQPGQGSPPKRSRGAAVSPRGRLGLGIQYEL
jgi:acetyl-CoA acyltransferase 1